MDVHGRLATKTATETVWGYTEKSAGHLCMSDRQSFSHSVIQSFSHLVSLVSFSANNAVTAVAAVFTRFFSQSFLFCWQFARFLAKYAQLALVLFQFVWLSHRFFILANRPWRSGSSMNQLQSLAKCNWQTQLSKQTRLSLFSRSPLKWLSIRP